MGVLLPLHKSISRDVTDLIVIINHGLRGDKPEYILSNTRGTAQKIVGLSSPISSTNNLTSCGHGNNMAYESSEIKRRKQEGIQTIGGNLTPRQKPIAAP